MKKILIVGAGFAGAVYARTLADAGMKVDVIDRRPHIAGNAYDEILPNGQRIHRYGPHLLHTNMKNVVEWLRRFGELTPYNHRVQALLADGRTVPLPINRATINAVFGSSLQTTDEVKDFLQQHAVPNKEPKNAADYLYAHIGQQLTDLFFRPYTKKMWAMDLEEMDAAVVKRIPIRFDDSDLYFPDDEFQFLPREGYTNLFRAIFDHTNITITLNTPFSKYMLRAYDHCFNSMAIDEYFDETLGPLPYRSIKFHHRQEPASYTCGSAPVINYTDDRPHTRQTDWSRLHGPPSNNQTHILTLEEPCDYRDNANERYYPVKTSDGRYETLYEKYRALAATEPRVTFIGRCGTYRYLDMHQVINQSLIGAGEWVKANT